MNTIPYLDAETLKKLRFIKMDESRDSKPPVGHLLLCYHNHYGMTLGYFVRDGSDYGYFILPYVQNRGFSYASHWQLHN